MSGKFKSLFDRIPKNMPAFPQTLSMIVEATRVGFQWEDWRGPLSKVKEELRELEVEIKRPRKNKKRMSEEVGDLLFSVCNLAFQLRLDPEHSLHLTLKTFRSRFHFLEKELRKKGKTPEKATLQEMTVLWRKAKRMKV
jgi:uncharacterized protein YabN with tetrapyrrole methylase and pyrophosphatase domain